METPYLLTISIILKYKKPFSMTRLKFQIKTYLPSKALHLPLLEILT